MTLKKQRIIFFGTPQGSVASLRSLGDAGHDVVGVFTQPDKPTGRKRLPVPSSVKAFAQKNNIAVFEPMTLKGDAAYEPFSILNPDMCVVVAYGKLIPKRFLDAPRMGFLNVHPSLLPRWRGPSPVKSALLNGDITTGVTIMQLDEEMDHGPVLAQQEIELDGTEYAPELTDRLFTIGAELLIETIERLSADTVAVREQDHRAATFCSKHTRDDARIDWTQSATHIERLVRAMAGDPVAWTTGDSLTINILKARAHKHQEPQTPPGTVLAYEKEIFVDTPEGTLELIEIQPSGGRPMSASEFVNGHAEFLGSRLK